jgi:copper transport protein
MKMSSQTMRTYGGIGLATLLLIAGIAAVCQLWLAQPVLAHANLVRAEPSPNSVLEQPPDRVTIWFTEPLEPEFSEIQVLDSQGGRVDQGNSVVDSTDPTTMSVLLSPLPDGTYTVAWENVSTIDGHRVVGSFVFSVGEPISGAPPTSQAIEQPLLQSRAEPVLRWLVLLSGLAIVGGLSFELLVTRHVLSGRNAGRDLRVLRERLASRSLKLLWVAMVIFLLASLGQLIVQTAAVFDASFQEILGSPIMDIITGTDWGNLWLWRVGLLLAIAVALSLDALWPSRESSHDGLKWDLPLVIRTLALAGGAGMLLTLSLTSHGAATLRIKFPAVFSDYLHLMAAGFWVGGLFHFALAAPVVMQTLTASQRRQVLSKLLPRFSTLAVLSVGTLIITGLYSGWAQVTIPEAVATPYGWTLLAKLALIVPLLILGAVNLLWVRRRLAREERAGQWLRWLVTDEALLAALVLLSVGMLTSLEPARQVASREGIGQKNQLTFQDTVEGADITLEIEPGRTGPNRFTVFLKDRLGRPITNATDVTLGFNYLDANLGENTALAQPAGAGNYVLEEGLLSIAGLWQVELVVRRPDAFDARTAFRFEVAPGGASGSNAIMPAANLGYLLLGVELVLLGFLFLTTGIPLGGWRTRGGAAVMGSGMAAALIGIFLAFNAQSPGMGTAETLRNPFPPNPESLEAGQQIYSQNCHMCHGDMGRGNGPLVASLNPPLADLVVHVPLHTEGDLFHIIHDGIPGTAMAPLREKLTNDEIWHVINYIKTFGE